jgi:hypothetical protein
LTSWFFRKTPANVNIVVANCRSREPSVLGLSESHVGNYEANLPLFSWRRRNSVTDPQVNSRDGRIIQGRSRWLATDGDTGVWKLLRNRTLIITNWATFYGDVILQGKTPKLHFPIMESDGIITSVWNNAIIFRPRAGQLGLLLITRQSLEPDGPLGERIV